MTIPVAEDQWITVESDCSWAALSTAAKHERILRAADHLFSKQGLDAPMPAVAALAGTGVGSLYRQFPSKRELLAELVSRRLEQIRDAAVAAAKQDCSHWQAFTDMLWTIVEQQHVDVFLGEAWSQVNDHDGVIAASADALGALGLLLDAARAEGMLRDDAQTLDVRLVFTATRAAKQVSPDSSRRILELLIDGLAARS